MKKLDPIKELIAQGEELIRKQEEAQKAEEERQKEAALMAWKNYQNKVLSSLPVPIQPNVKFMEDWHEGSKPPEGGSMTCVAFVIEIQGLYPVALQTTGDGEILRYFVPPIGSDGTPDWALDSFSPTFEYTYRLEVKDLPIALALAKQRFEKAQRAKVEGQQVKVKTVELSYVPVETTDIEPGFFQTRDELGAFIDERIAAARG